MSEQGDLALGNTLAALALALTDRIDQAVAVEAGRGSQAPAALVALSEFLGGGSIEQLRQALGLSHSATVRLVDRLVTDGHVYRADGAADGRTVALALTSRGRRAAQGVLSARQAAVEELLVSLSEEERTSLQNVTARLLADITRSRLADRAAGRPPRSGWMCRLCGFLACGRPDGRCPSATAAAAVTTQIS